MDQFGYLLQPGTQEPVEYIPVDDFFDQYLEVLNFADDGDPAAGMAKGARVEAKERPEAEQATTDSSTLYSWHSDSTVSPTAASQPPQLSGGTYMSRSGSDASAGSTPTIVMSQQPPQQLPPGAGGYGQVPSGYSAPPVGVPTVPVPSANPVITVTAPPVTSGGFSGPPSSMVTTGPQVPVPAVATGPPPITSGGSVVITGMPDQLQDRKAPQPKQRRRRVRDERQQMLNKLAQIRYREKKRSKAQTLEQQISALEAHLAELQVRQAENEDLAQQNRALEAQIEAKDANIAQARVGASGAQSPADAGSPTVSGGSARGGLPQDSPADLDQLVKDWLAKSKEIMNLVELIGLGDGNKTAAGRLKNDVKRSVRKTFSPKTRDVLKHVEQRMGEMVSDVTTLCMRVMRLQGAQVEQLMTADYDMVCSLKGWKDEAKWLKAARELNFTTEQRRRVLAARDEALQKLNELYTERRMLNQQVLVTLQPGLFQPLAGGDGDAAATAAAREMVRLLDALGANLAAEQQELARQDWVLFRQLLTPIQSGLLVALSFPDHCDALALMNGVQATCVADAA